VSCPNPPPALDPAPSNETAAAATLRERTRIVQARARQYLARMPGAAVLCVAVGAHERHRPLDEGGRRWLVAEEQGAGDSECGWRAVAEAGVQGLPLLVLGDGLAARMPVPELRRWLATLGERAAGGSRILLDLPAASAIRSPAELAALHPRLRIEAVHPVAEGLGLGRWLLGTGFRVLTGVPWYAVFELAVEVGPASPAHAAVGRRESGPVRAGLGHA
jgi:hypothetical protein